MGVEVGGKGHRVQRVRAGSGWHWKLDGRELPVDVVFSQSGVLSILLNGKSYEVKQETAGPETSIVVGNERFRASIRDPRSLRSRRRGADSGQGVKKLSAPMPGKVVRILAPAGTEVEAGKPLLVLEAVKMQNELKSPNTGRVKKIAVSEGAALEAGHGHAEVECIRPRLP